jgi:hypothetical protein
MSKGNLIIIHFQPLELYPPIQNLISVLEKKEFSKKTTIISTYQSEFVNFGSRLSESNQIFRKNVHATGRILRLLKYINFYFFAFFKIIQLKPSKIIYFESISALPALLYKKMYRKTELFVHYHEYTTMNEYSSGMQIVNWNHYLEKKSFNEFKWISQTNKKRLELFHKDNPNVQSEILHILPNYPLASWSKKIITINDTIDKPSERLKLVYIGALSIEDTYIKEIIDFVSANQENYELEIFSLKIDKELNEYLLSKNCFNIRFSRSIEYLDIPAVLKTKDIGLILYKGKTLNYIHNAPNKLFEYLSCGLDVWYPKEMEGCSEYQSEAYPKVVEVNFHKIEESLKKYSFSNESNTNQLNIFSAEEATIELLKELLND